MSPQKTSGCSTWNPGSRKPACSALADAGRRASAALASNSAANSSATCVARPRSGLDPVVLAAVTSTPRSWLPVRRRARPDGITGGRKSGRILRVAADGPASEQRGEALDARVHVLRPHGREGQPELVAAGSVDVAGRALDERDAGLVRAARQGVDVDAGQPQPQEVAA